VQASVRPRQDDASIVVVKVHELKAEMDERFARVDERFERVDEQFADVVRQLTELREQTTRLADEGAHTRRHFDVVAEQLKAEFRQLAADIIAAYDRTATRLSDVESRGATMYAALDDHELRLRVLERRRRTR
jgi:septation ring formation regulator EzrA